MGSFHLEKLRHHPEVELTGVFDKNIACIKNLESAQGINVFSTVEELIFESDALIIASPTGSHFGYAKMALENGLHVFVEKPICEKVEEANELVKLSEEKKRVLQTGFVERYRWLALSQSLPPDFLVKPSVIGTERIASQPSREKELDVVMDLMIHDVDLVLWLLREPPVSIVAEGVSLGLTEIDVAHARLEFASGTVAHLKTSWGMPGKRRETHLAWPNRSLTYDLLTGKGQWLAASFSQELPPYQKDSLFEQLECFVAAIQGKMNVMVSGADGLKALEICHEIRKNIQTRKQEKLNISPRERKFLSNFWEKHVH